MRHMECITATFSQHPTLAQTFHTRNSRYDPWASRTLCENAVPAIKTSHRITFLKGKLSINKQNYLKFWQLSILMIYKNSIHSIVRPF